MLQPGASHKTAGKKKAKQISKMKANCSVIIMRIITPQPLKSHDAEPMGPYASKSILDCIFLHHIQAYQGLDAWLLNRGDNTKTLVGMAKRWLCPLNGGWTACQEIIACHDFCMITIVVTIYLLRPSLFSCHFFHNPPFWGAQKNCDPPLFSTSPPPLLISDKSLVLLSCSPGFINPPSFPKNRPFYSYGV